MGDREGVLKFWSIIMSEIKTWNQKEHVLVTGSPFVFHLDEIEKDQKAFEGGQMAVETQFPVSSDFEDGKIIEEYLSLEQDDFDDNSAENGVGTSTSTGTQ